MSIYRRKGSPHWWISISVAGRKTRRSTGTSDRIQAKEFEIRESERLWRVHKLGDRGSLRFAEAAAQWLDSIPERSRYKEGSVISWFEMQIGDEPLRNIDRDAVLEIRELLIAEGKTPQRTDRYMANLRAVLRKAVEMGHMEAAPPVPMYAKRSAEPRWLTHPQFLALKKELPTHLALAAEFAVYTGLRMRSMLALTWDRVDLREERLWVPGDQMKGARAHGLPLSDEARRVLRALKTLSPTGESVFQYEGRPIDDCNTRAFKNAVERSKVGPLRWHDLRHTFAAWAVQSGVPLFELMQLGGWRTYSMVLRYSHLAPEHLAKSANRIARYGHTAKPRKLRKA